MSRFAKEANVYQQGNVFCKAILPFFISYFAEFLLKMKYRPQYMIERITNILLFKMIFKSIVLFGVAV